MSMHDDDSIDIFDDEDVPEKSNNRTFLLIVGGLGLVMLLALICLAGYVFLNGNSNQVSEATSQAQATIQESTVQAALTATAVAAQAQIETMAATSTVVPTKTYTPIFAEATGTFTETSNPPTATVGAAFTQIAVSTQTIFPTFTSLPPTNTPAITKPTETFTETPNPATATVGAAFTQIAVSTQTIIPTTTALPNTGGGGDENPPTGQVEITYPLNMIVDEDDTLTIEIRFNTEIASIDYNPVPSTAEISLAPSSQSKLRGSLVNPIMLYPSMLVELVAPNFDIIGDVSNNERTILKGQPSVWTWSIRARKSGTQIITIKISGKSDFGNGISTFLVKSQSINITVVDKPLLARISDNLAKNWATILGTGGPLALILSYFINLRGKSENKKESEKLKDKIEDNITVVDKPVLTTNSDNLTKNWLIVLGSGGFLALILSYLLYWKAKNENDMLKNKIGDLEKRVRRLRRTR